MLNKLYKILIRCVKLILIFIIEEILISSYSWIIWVLSPLWHFLNFLEFKWRKFWRNDFHYFMGIIQDYFRLLEHFIDTGWDNLRLKYPKVFKKRKRETMLHYCITRIQDIFMYIEHFCSTLFDFLCLYFRKFLKWVYS